MSSVSSVSKQLSYILRHNPGSAGLSVDAAGWTSVPTLLQALKLTPDLLDQVVAENNKKRFEYSADKLRIRASQGHSIPVELGYDAQTPPDILFHGTTKDTVPLICQTGIQKMSRHAVHLSSDTGTALNVGGRHGTPVILQVRALEMSKAGHLFYKSTNGVWLTDFVPPCYVIVP